MQETIAPIDHEDPFPATIEGGMILIGVSATWKGPLKASERCPHCKGSPKPTHYCIACDRWGGDGKRILPGLPVGKYLDPEYVHEQ